MPAIDDEELIGDPELIIPTTIGEEIKRRDPYDMGTNILTEKTTQQNTVINYLRGYQWKVDYFNNLSGVNDEVNSVSEVLDDSIQKYNRFKDLIIYLDSPLPPGDLTELTTNGTINAFIVPKINDHFKAVMLDNRIGIFTVTEVKNLTYQSHEVYDITFKFLQFEDSDYTLSQNLEDKSVGKYVYDENHVSDNGAPVILEEDLKKKISFRTEMSKIINLYFSLFTDKETLFLNPFGRNPDRHLDLLLVDNLLNNFIIKTIDMNVYERKNKMKDFDYTQNPELFRTIWDALIERDSDYLFSIQPNLTWTCIEKTWATPASRNLSYLGVNGVVDIITIDEVKRQVTNKDKLFQRPKCPEGLNVNYPLLLEDDKLEYYVFDRCFYNENLTKMTPFQHIVKRFLIGEKISTDELEEYVNHWRYWSKYEQYYIIPILLLLMKSCLLNKHRSM